MNEQRVPSPAELFDLTGRVAVVTGASSGLGAYFAEVLAAAGADVVLAARRAERLAGVEARVRALGRSCVSVAADVSRPEDCQRLVDEAVTHLGGVDVLVNNAGVSRTTPAQHEDPADFASVVATNLTGSYLAAQAFARWCIGDGRGGSIVNISSALALAGGELPQAAYSASKAGQLGLTRDLAMQWSGRKGIRVNAIAPGFFTTEMTEALDEQPELRQRLADRSALGRFGAVSELAGALLLLASDAGSYITGSTLAVDGGWSLH